MHRLRAWFYGWTETFRLMIFERETYRFLRSYEIEDHGPVEVREEEKR